MASERSPCCPYHSLARRCRSRDLLRLLLFEVGAKDVGEEVVIAVPPAPVIEWDDQEVGSLEPLQHGLSTSAFGYGVAERPAELVKDARAKEKASDLVGLSGEYLLHQVIDDVAVVAGETGDEAGNVVTSLHRKRCQLQGSDPALRAGFECINVLRPQIETHDFVEVRRGLLGREAQISGADLHQISPCAKPRQRQRRVGAGGDEQVGVRREVLQQEGYALLDALVIDQVVIVEHQVQLA